jgi:hypothetical protein
MQIHTNNEKNRSLQTKFTFRPKQKVHADPWLREKILYTAQNNNRSHVLLISYLPALVYHDVISAQTHQHQIPIFDLFLNLQHCLLLNIAFHILPSK